MDSREKNVLGNLYMPDTNCFRYSAYIINKNDTSKREYKRAAIQFWEKIKIESETEESTLLVSAEVVNELTIQSHILKEKENRIISNLLRMLDVETFEVPQEVEYNLRNFSNYARKTYGSQLTPSGRSMDYLKASDARIFIHSYINDGILSTANIKDFLLYPLFFEPEENMLYDILNQEYVKIPLEGREFVEQDPIYQELLYKMRELKY